MQPVEVKVEGEGPQKKVVIDLGEYQVTLEVKPKRQTAAPSEVKLALVLDQTHRGYSQTLERYTPPNVEIHEITGIGLAGVVKAGERTYRHAASDDYDVLRLLESLAKKFTVTLFITGDKTLSEEAKLLRTAKNLNVEVHYMPPSEFTGKEAVIQAILDVVHRHVS